MVGSTTVCFTRVDSSCPMGPPAGEADGPHTSLIVPTRNQNPYGTGASDGNFYGVRNQFNPISIENCRKASNNNLCSLCPFLAMTVSINLWGSRHLVLDRPTNDRCLSNVTYGACDLVQGSVGLNAWNRVRIIQSKSRIIDGRNLHNATVTYGRNRV